MMPHRATVHPRRLQTTVNAGDIALDAKVRPTGGIVKLVENETGRTVTGHVDVHWQVFSERSNLWVDTEGASFVAADGRLALPPGP